MSIRLLYQPLKPRVGANVPVNFFFDGKGNPNGRNQKGREGVSRRKEREGENERTYLQPETSNP
jgi:hypothetical protein